MKRMHLVVANALLAHRRRLPDERLIRAARDAARWVHDVSVSLIGSAYAEHTIWADKFSCLVEMEAECKVPPWLRDPDVPLHTRSDKRAMRTEIDRRQRRLSKLGSIWLSLQPKKRRGK